MSSDDRQVDSTAPPIRSFPGRRLSSSDLLRGPRTAVEIPEIPDDAGAPGVVYIRRLSAGQVLRFIQSKEDLTTVPGILSSKEVVNMIADVVVDESGAPLFDRTAAEEIRTADFTVFMRLANACVEQIGKAFGILTPAAATGLGGAAVAAAEKKEAEDEAAGKVPTEAAPTLSTPSPPGPASPTDSPSN